MDVMKGHTSRRFSVVLFQLPYKDRWLYEVMTPVFHIFASHAWLILRNKKMRVPAEIFTILGPFFFFTWIFWCLIKYEHRLQSFSYWSNLQCLLLFFYFGIYFHLSVWSLMFFDNFTLSWIWSQSQDKEILLVIFFNNWQLCVEQTQQPTSFQTNFKCQSIPW